MSTKDNSYWYVVDLAPKKQLIPELEEQIRQKRSREGKKGGSHPNQTKVTLTHAETNISISFDSLVEQKEFLGYANRSSNLGCATRSQLAKGNKIQSKKSPGDWFYVKKQN